MIFIAVSTGHFDPLIEACDRLRTRYSFFGQIGSGTYVPHFPYFRMAPPLVLEDYMKKAELVICHAGTGMLSMLYRLQKPAIIIPKQIRYGEANDGQVELAQKWAEHQMAVLMMDVGEMELALERAKGFPFAFPYFPSLGKALIQELAPKPDSVDSLKLADSQAP